jgi:hypothetical protein
MTNATERHAALIDAGWSVRLDGLWRPPSHWHDPRVYTPSAAWSAQCERDRDDVDAELGDA